MKRVDYSASVVFSLVLVIIVSVASTVRAGEDTGPAFKTVPAPSITIVGKRVTLGELNHLSSCTGSNAEVAIANLFFSSQIVRPSIGPGMVEGYDPGRSRNFDPGKEQNSMQFDPGVYVSPEAMVSLIGWKADNCTNVIIFGSDCNPHPPIGAVTGDGSFIFIAEGPGGRTAQAVGCYPEDLSLRKILHSQLNAIDQANVFNDKEFFDLSAQRKYSTRSPITQIAQTVSDALTRRGFSSGSLMFPSGDCDEIIYTLTYEPLLSIVQTPDERKRDGELVRQAAFTILLQVGTNASPAVECTLKVRPFVRINYPRDNNRWTNAVADVALKESEAIAEEVKNLTMAK